MRKMFLFVVVAIAASQLVAAVYVDPNLTATWSQEPTTVTAMGGETYNWSTGQVWSNYMYNTMKGDVVAVYPQDTVTGTGDWKTGDALTVKVVTTGGKFLQNGSSENRVNDNTNLRIALDGLTARYDHIDNGGAWKHWIDTPDDPNGHSFRVSHYLVMGTPDGKIKNGGNDKGWKYPGPDPVYPAFTDAQVPDGLCYGYAMTYKKDGLNVYNGIPVDGVAQFLRNCTFDSSKEITFTAQIGKFPAELMAYNGYYLQIAVGGTEAFTGQFQQGNGTPFVYGGTVIAETYGDPNTTGGADLSWHTASVTYTPNPADRMYDGMPIQVRILVPEIPGAIPGNQWPTVVDIAAVAFDDCKLTIDGAEGIEAGPSTIQVGCKANTGEIATTEILVYDDACAMSRAIGTLAGDINKDCAVDIADLAELSATWLADVDTAPVVLVP